MQIGTTDLEQIRGSVGNLRDSAGEHLDEVQSYLDGGDFSDTQLHVEMASRLAHTLNQFAEIQMWDTWDKIVSNLIDAKGEDASLEDVAAVLTSNVIGRSMRLTTTTGRGPLADIYGLLLTQHFAEAVQVCNFKEGVAKFSREVAEELAAKLNISVEEVEKRLADRDPVVVQQFASLAMVTVREKLTERGIPIPDVPEGVLDVLGLNQDGVIVGDVSEFQQDTGVGGDGRLVPRYNDDDERPAPAIKIG